MHTAHSSPKLLTHAVWMHKKCAWVSGCGGARRELSCWMRAHTHHWLGWCEVGSEESVSWPPHLPPSSSSQQFVGVQRLASRLSHGTRPERTFHLYKKHDAFIFIFFLFNSGVCLKKEYFKARKTYLAWNREESSRNRLWTADHCFSWKNSWNKMTKSKGLLAALGLCLIISSF